MGAGVDEEDVERIAHDFHVSPFVIQYQIANHRLANLSFREIAAGDVPEIL